ncbi:MAG TPA: hypothetical protein VFJ91_09955 [Gaiellaceae bacterium]|nr:hypothetical protein [Gaiellaceae bacterium]
MSLRRPLLLLLALLAVASAGLAHAHDAHAAVLAPPWCGSGEPTADQPDAVSAFSWHVLYATPSDGQDAFAATAPRIAGDVQAVTDWWRSQDQTRTLRFDLLSTPGCGSDAGRVDISFLRLPDAAASYDYDAIAAAARDAGFDSPDKGYLVYYDGARSDQTLCGQGAEDRVSFAYVIVYLRACDLATDDVVRPIVAVHEMVHGLGAVSPDAPNFCNQGHVCDSSADLMKAVLDGSETLAGMKLDVGHDDYYEHAGDWTDVRDSLLLWRFDDPRPAPPTISALTATSCCAGSVSVSWGAAPAGYTFRIYDLTGALVRDDAETSLSTAGNVGDTLGWTIRTVDDTGLLGVPATLRFKVGYGIVDANGTLLQDTVAPAAPTRLRATKKGKQVVFAWSRVADPIGLRGYRLVVPGVMQRLTTGTALKLPLAKVRGRAVQVRAVDEAGNVSDPVTVRVRR